MLVLLVSELSWSCWILEGYLTWNYYRARVGIPTSDAKLRNQSLVVGAHISFFGLLQSSPSKSLPYLSSVMETHVCPLWRPIVAQRVRLDRKEVVATLCYSLFQQKFYYDVAKLWNHWIWEHVWCKLHPLASQSRLTDDPLFLPSEPAVSFFAPFPPASFALVSLAIRVSSLHTITLMNGVCVPFMHR